jgi:hypothetical protein
MGEFHKLVDEQKLSVIDAAEYLAKKRYGHVK